MTLKKAADYIPQSFIGKRVRVVLDTGSETIVEQSHVEETNVNKIIGRYMKSGHLPPGSHEPRYEDVSQVGDLMDIHEQMKEAQEMYDCLPESLKEKFSMADLSTATAADIEALKDGNIDTPTDTDNTSNPPVQPATGLHDAATPGEPATGEPTSAEVSTQ